MYCCHVYTFSLLFSSFFFFNDTATTEIYTLSLHDALPIFQRMRRNPATHDRSGSNNLLDRSEEHTSELQSRSDIVCRLLLEKKKKKHLFLIYTKKKKKTKNKNQQKVK